MQLGLLWKVGSQPHLRTVDNQTILIGRKPHCDIILNDITVSRQHAEVFVKDGHYYLRNLSQRNPIYIYGKLVLAEGESMPLASVYGLQLGYKKLRIKSVEAAQQILQLTEQDQAYTVAAHKPVIIGRQEDCDIVLKNTTVSRQHAKIFAQRDAFHLLNLSQTTEIYVNTRQQVMPRQIAPIDVGNIIRLGLVKLYIHSIKSMADELDLSPLLKIQCPGCRHKLSQTIKDCPWCGLSLAGGATVH